MLVVGSGPRGNLATRLARMGHRVVCADPSRTMCERAWDVVAIDGSGCHDAAALIAALPDDRGATMFVGDDPRRVSLDRPAVFCFSDESDAGYARALRMCAALAGAVDTGRVEMACAGARTATGGRAWSGAALTAAP